MFLSDVKSPDLGFLAIVSTHHLHGPNGLAWEGALIIEAWRCPEFADFSFGCQK
jgi:hypothetical protein